MTKFLQIMCAQLKKYIFFVKTYMESFSNIRFFLVVHHLVFRFCEHEWYLYYTV